MYKYIIKGSKECMSKYNTQ